LNTYAQGFAFLGAAAGTGTGAYWIFAFSLSLKWLTLAAPISTFSTLPSSFLRSWSLTVLSFSRYLSNSKKSIM
jgi:hypothetical protein